MTRLHRKPVPPTKVSTNPVVRVFAADAKSFGTPKVPFVATSYRLAAHSTTATRTSTDNAVLQPEMFVEIGERLAKARASRAARVEISSQRGRRSRTRRVTKRLRPILVDGKPCDIVGLPNPSALSG